MVVVIHNESLSSNIFLAALTLTIVRAWIVFFRWWRQVSIILSVTTPYQIPMASSCLVISFSLSAFFLASRSQISISEISMPVGTALKAVTC